MTLMASTILTQSVLEAFNHGGYLSYHTILIHPHVWETEHFE